MTYKIGDKVKYGEIEYEFVVVGFRKHPILNDGVYIRPTGIGKTICKKMILVSSNHLQKVENEKGNI